MREKVHRVLAHACVFWDRVTSAVAYNSKETIVRLQQVCYKAPVSHSTAESLLLKVVDEERSTIMASS